MTQAIKCEEPGCGGSAYSVRGDLMLCQLCYTTSALSSAQGRTFSTGATRDTNEGKLDFRGFLSPSVIKRYAEYMHKNRIQSDGELRAGDNWKKGIPKDTYMESMWRHFFSVWDGFENGADIDEELCALLFNVCGMLHERLKDE